MQRDPAVKSVPQDGWNQGSEPQKRKQIGTAGFQDSIYPSAHRRKHKHEDNKAAITCLLSSPRPMAAASAYHSQEQPSFFSSPAQNM